MAKLGTTELLISLDESCDCLAVVTKEHYKAQYPTGSGIPDQVRVTNTSNVWGVSQQLLDKALKELGYVRIKMMTESPPCQNFAGNPRINGGASKSTNPTETP